MTNGKFTVDDIAKFPLPGMDMPRSFVFSADDTQLFYLFQVEKGIPKQQLYAFDVESGGTTVAVAPPDGGVKEENLSVEEELRRQRERMLVTGLTHFSYVAYADRLLIPISGDLYVQDGVSATLQKISDSGASPALTPKLSKDGKWIAFVRDGEVFVISASGGIPVQITHAEAGSGKTNGLADYIAQEELSRSDGFWWSPDAEWIAYTEVDETHIPVYRIVHQGKDSVGDGAQEDHHYPFAGMENPHVRLFVTDREGKQTVEMDMDFGHEVYIVRVFWWSDAELGAVCLNRAQDTVYLARFDVASGQRTLIIQETSDYWITFTERYFWQLSDGRFLWLSVRDGYQHIYLLDAYGRVLRQLTKGQWVVDDLEAVDEAAGIVYFTGNRESPLEKYLYAVGLDGGEVSLVTQSAGTHNVFIDHGCKHFVDVYSALDMPPTVFLRSLETGAVIYEIFTPDDPRLESFDLEPPEIVKLSNRDGVTLYGLVYRPPERYGQGPYPVIVHVYGGPGPQMVGNEWKHTAALQLQYLRNQGFLVFRLDNRGSPRRGMDFEGAIKGRMGTVEVDDQVDGVRWLVEQGLANPERIGMYGWSYGGYMTLMCLTRAADVFKVGVAGAPVTHWDGYDTCYTERYMDIPAENPTGYEEGSVMAHIDKLQGKLLLIHGMIDENVHFRHTARLINALIAARKPYDIVLFPDERHMPRRVAERIYLNEQLIGYFEKNL